MLVISRRVGESVRIGENCYLKIDHVDRHSGAVKLVFDAPLDVQILRTEIIKNKRKHKAIRTAWGEVEDGGL